jgi:hypothetical protein
METSPATKEAMRRGTPRWALQAAKAEAYHSMMLWAVTTYNLHADAANTGSVANPMPKYHLVQDPTPAATLA